MQAATARQTQAAPMGGFKGGEATFFSHYKTDLTYPCGAPGFVLIGPADTAERHYVDKPRVQFADHHYSTKDPATARGLIEDKNFGQSWGWVLDDTALPDEVSKLFGAVPIETRRKIAIGAVEGMSGLELRALISDEDLSAAAEAKPGSTGWMVQCPHQGCGLEIKGDNQKGKMTQDAARKMMEVHINSAHANQKIVK